MSDTSGAQTVQAKAGEVKEKAVALAIGEKAAVVFIFGKKTVQKLWPDFIGFLADAGADDGRGGGACGAKRFHSIKGGFEHASQRAFPACMGRADHAMGGIGEQNGLAICCQHGDGEAGGGGYKRIGFGFVACQHRRDGQGNGGVDLVDCDQGFGGEVEGLGGACAVDGDDLGLIRRPGAAVEPGEDTRGGPALAREEAMPGGECV